MGRADLSPPRLTFRSLSHIHGSSLSTLFICPPIAPLITLQPCIGMDEDEKRAV
mgnify:CR=1 FL=1